MEIQWSVLYTMPKILLHLKITAPPNVNHCIIYNLCLSNSVIHSGFQQSQNQLHKQQNMKHKNRMNYTKYNRTQQHEQQQNNLGKIFIGILNVNVTIDDSNELFGFETTKYLRSNT